MQNKRIALASNNSHKIAELRLLLQPLSYDILSPQELNQHDFDPLETGTTFQENARIKAFDLYKRTGLPSLSDDSGIVVEALGGEPGIYSARYGGDGLNDKDRALLLLKNMEGITNRKAYFFCVLCYIDNSGEKFFEGRVDGKIGTTYKEGGGFGYDPIFYYPPMDKFFSELSPPEKNKLSHRGLATKSWIDYLSQEK